MEEIKKNNNKVILTTNAKNCGIVYANGKER